MLPNAFPPPRTEAAGENCADDVDAAEVDESTPRLREALRCDERVMDDGRMSMPPSPSSELASCRASSAARAAALRPFITSGSSISKRHDLPTRCGPFMSRTTL